MKILPKIKNNIESEKKKVRWIHPHLAREKNLSDRESLESKLDKISKTHRKLK